MCRTGDDAIIHKHLNQQLQLMLRREMDVEDDDDALCSENLLDSCQKQTNIIDNIGICPRIYMHRKYKEKINAILTN